MYYKPLLSTGQNWLNNMKNFEPCVIVVGFFLLLCPGVICHLPCSDCHYCGLQSSPAWVPRWPLACVLPQPLLPVWHGEVSDIHLCISCLSNKTGTLRTYVNAAELVKMVHSSFSGMVNPYSLNQLLFQKLIFHIHSLLFSFYSCVILILSSGFETLNCY